MDIQMLVVKIIIGLALLLAGRWIFQKLTRKGNCCDGCGGKCGHKKSCR